MEIAILGQGRLGRTLRLLLAEGGHSVTTWRRGEAWPRSPVVLIAVSDEAIAEVARALPLGPVVLHCAGASDLDVLAPHVRVGSMHPLLSFPGPERGIPRLQGAVAAVAGREGGLEAATELALALGLDPVEVPGDRRLYHAAAVMAGNFATVLLASAAELLVSAGVDPRRAPQLLAPLAQASVSGSAALDPGAALTGPLSRGDGATVARHLDALRERHPELLPVYVSIARVAVEALLPRAGVPPERLRGVVEALQAALPAQSALESAAVAAPNSGAIFHSER